MVPVLIPTPSAQALLPPLLASLPTSFASPRPPPVLPPLLTPLLRQRLELLSHSSSGAPESWLPLLCWDASRGSQLSSVIERKVETGEFELHPVSGEVEFDLDTTSNGGGMEWIRRDQETLVVRIPLKDLGFEVNYLWCMGDAQSGEAGYGWKVCEVNPLSEGQEDQEGEKWYGSMSEADEVFRQKDFEESLQKQRSSTGIESTSNVATIVHPASNADDDDDYWAMYDRSPGRTPANKDSITAAGATPSVARTTTADGNSRRPSEEEYFSQYADVQPAMENHDPDEQHDDIGESTLNGNIVTRDAMHLEASNQTQFASAEEGLLHPRPSSSSSTRSDVAKLEETAASQTQSETGIKHHISTSFKSLYRLARSAGIEREEFERIVRTELEVLGMMEEDID